MSTYAVFPHERYQVEIDYLAPCLICGKKPSQKYGIRIANSRTDTYGVCCGKCGNYASAENLADAVSKWNAENLKDGDR